MLEFRLFCLFGLNQRIQLKTIKFIITNVNSVLKYVMYHFFIRM